MSPIEYKHLPEIIMDAHYSLKIIMGTTRNKK